MCGFDLCWNNYTRVNIWGGSESMNPWSFILWLESNHLNIICRLSNQFKVSESGIYFSNCIYHDYNLLCMFNVIQIQIKRKQNKKHNEKVQMWELYNLKHFDIYVFFCLFCKFEIFQSKLINRFVPDVDQHVENWFETNF